MGLIGPKGKAGLDGETGETGPSGGKGYTVSKKMFLRFFSAITDSSKKGWKLLSLLLLFTLNCFWVLLWNVYIRILCSVTKRPRFLPCQVIGQNIPRKPPSVFVLSYQVKKGLHFFFMVIAKNKLWPFFLLCLGWYRSLRRNWRNRARW